MTDPRRAAAEAKAAERLVFSDAFEDFLSAYCRSYDPMRAGSCEDRVALQRLLIPTLAEALLAFAGQYLADEIASGRVYGKATAEARREEREACARLASTAACSSSSGTAAVCNALATAMRRRREGE